MTTPICDGAHQHAFHPNRHHRQAFIQTYCNNCEPTMKQHCRNLAHTANRDGITSADNHTIHNPIQEGVWGGTDFTRLTHSNDKTGGQETVPQWLKRIGQTEWEKDNPA